jgi:Ca2+-binding EF-hand superfamily protein
MYQDMPRSVAAERGIGAPDAADRFVLPELGLEDSNAVLMSSMAAVRKERESARAPAVELSELFSSEELGQLGEAWLTVDGEDTGSIDAGDLLHVLHALSISPTSEEFETILRSLGTDRAGTVSWAMFVNLMADLKAPASSP